MEKQYTSLKEKGSKILYYSLRLLNKLKAVKALEAAAAASKSSAISSFPLLILISFISNNTFLLANLLD